MKAIWGILLLSWVATMDARSPEEKPKFRCDYTYFEEADGFLKFHEIPSTWDEARLKCAIEGAKLASPSNERLRAAMKKKMDKINFSGSMYMGIHATLSKGDFSSLEGIPLTRIPHEWGINEPDNYQNQEDCMVVFSDTISLADVPCNETFPYMCFISRDSVGQFTKACGTSDPEYTLDERTGSCYKFHKAPRTWSRAYSTCVLEGGHLTILNSDTEAEVIKEIYEKNPSFTKNGIFVGLYNLKVTGDWLTINDETLKEAGYANWAPGEPNNTNNNEYCGIVNRNAMFNDINCETPTVFICERGPESLKCED